MYIFLQNVFRSSADVFKENNSNTESNCGKSFEEFNSILDQMEMHLQTALITFRQTKQSETYLPLPINGFNNNNIQRDQISLTYDQFLKVVKNQITYRNLLRNELLMAAEKIPK